MWHHYIERDRRRTQLASEPQALCAIRGKMERDPLIFERAFDQAMNIWIIVDHEQGGGGGR